MVSCAFVNRSIKSCMIPPVITTRHCEEGGLPDEAISCFEEIASSPFDCAAKERRLRSGLLAMTK